MISLESYPKDQLQYIADCILFIFFPVFLSPNFIWAQWYSQLDVSIIQSCQRYCMKMMLHTNYLSHVLVNPFRFPHLQHDKSMDIWLSCSLMLLGLHMFIQMHHSHCFCNIYQVKKESEWFSDFLKLSPGTAYALHIQLMFGWKLMKYVIHSFHSFSNFCSVIRVSVFSIETPEPLFEFSKF